MRLTEICFDFHFNPVNPEQPIIQKYENKTAADFHNYEIDRIEDSGNNALTAVFHETSPSVTFSATPSPALTAGDKNL